MAKKRFRIKDAQGNVVPYDVAAEDVTLSDGRSVETGKASVLNNAGFLDPAHFPKLMLYNVTPFTSEPDYSAIPVGSIYLDEREDAPYKRLFYKKNIDGNTQTIDLGAPQDGVVYCHQSTGILYRWVPTSYGRDGSFQQVGGDADLRDDSNHVKQSLATPVVLRNVSATMLDDLAVGDVYFEEGHLYCHVSSSNDADLGAPSKKLIYYCLADSKCYRWTGSSFTAISITPHIDTTTGNWFIGNYNTGVHAQGPKGNSVVDGDTFCVINNLTEGGEEDALSAEMGKELVRLIGLSQISVYVSGNQLVFAGSTTPVLRITAAQASIAKGGSGMIRVEGGNLEGSVTLTIASGNGFSFEDNSTVLTKNISMIDVMAGVDVPIYFDGTEASTAVIVASSENVAAVSVSLEGTVLPSAYTELEYVSGATIGVRPGIASIGSRWELVLQCAAIPAASQIIICSDAYGGHFAEALNTGVWGLLGEGCNTTIPVTQKSVIEVTFTQKGITMSVGGQTVTRENQTRDNYETVCLFQENATTNFTYTGKVFSARCLQGGNFYGIPCKRNSDNKQGLYDLANGIFYPIK